MTATYEEMLKWTHCPDHECPYCGEVLTDDFYDKEAVVTKCKYCSYSFVE